MCWEKINLDTQINFVIWFCNFSFYVSCTEFQFLIILIFLFVIFLYWSLSTRSHKFVIKDYLPECACVKYQHANNGSVTWPCVKCGSLAQHAKRSVWDWNNNLQWQCSALELFELRENGPENWRFAWKASQRTRRTWKRSSIPHWCCSSRLWSQRINL